MTALCESEGPSQVSSRDRPRCRTSTNDGNVVTSVPVCASSLLLYMTCIHRWGWSLVLHADGTYTATSPDRTRTLHTHSPPATAA
jgi:hypothetical protein